VPESLLDPPEEELDPEPELEELELDDELEVEEAGLLTLGAVGSICVALQPSR
jgi:hypothetical protein